MQIQKFVPVALVLCLGVSTACQLSLGKTGQLRLPKSTAVNGQPSQTTATSSPPLQTRSINKEFLACQQQVSEKFVNNDFEWIDREASRLRVTKERLAGGSWKLRALYEALEVPQRQADGNTEWETLISKLQRWIEHNPKSITARVALAATWKNYALEARGNGLAKTVTDNGWELHRQRLANASQVLDTATSLDERCPYWYVAALFVGIGQAWDRAEFDRMFTAAVELEPTFYYLYQVKATYLLPRWHGEEGEWERFADESTLKVGGPEGDIIFFAIYSLMIPLHDATFMNTRQKAWPRLLNGFRSIEKLHGISASRLNEACYLAYGADDNRTAVELFERIGQDYDERVWRSKARFERFKQGAVMKEQTERENKIAGRVFP